MAKKTSDKNVQKVKSQDFFEKFYRGLATIIVKVLVKTSITGNMVTIFRGFLFIPFCLMMAFYSYLNIPAWIAYLLAFFGVQIWDTLDCADGQLARAKKSASNLGEWMEIFVDRPLGNLAGLFGLCLAYGLWLAIGSVLIWVFMFAIAVGWLLKTTFIYIDIIGDIPASADKKWRTKARDKKGSFLGKVLFFFHYRELGIFNICALLFWPLQNFLGINVMFYYLLFYAVLHNIIWLGIAYIQYKNLK